ncbi:MAG: response regulator [Deltaproteobacteria bacterium]|nr:MAG: response regulator [Deltaproteobacteria bacterium]
MLKIFYLDDEELLLDLFLDYFESENTDLHTFLSPEDAIQAARQSPPDIFFIDFRMPVMNGDDVAFAVDEDIPKYLVTGDINIKHKYKFDGVINKPYKYEDISKIIELHQKRRS